MHATDFIKSSLITSRQWTRSLIEDLKDEPLAQPTVKGGNHALWILGHLAYSDSSILHEIIQGQKTCPLHALKDQFDFKSEPTTNASDYPPFDELMGYFESAQAELLVYLDSITNADLDNPAIGCPDEWKDFFGTIGQCLAVSIMHPTMHYGQLADTRRALGRERLMA